MTMLVEDTDAGRFSSINRAAVNHAPRICGLPVYRKRECGKQKDRTAALHISIVTGLTELLA